MQANVAIERVGQVGTVWRLRRLVGEQLGLGGQRQAFEVVPGPDFGQPRSPEGVGLEHLVETCPQLPKVQVAEPVRMLSRRGRRSQGPHVNSRIIRWPTTAAALTPSSPA